MFKKILRKVLTKTGAGAPKPPARITLERSGLDRIHLREGLWLELWNKPETYEIHVFADGDENEGRLVGISHNYGLVRYMMNYGNLSARVLSFSNAEVTIEIAF